MSGRVLLYGATGYTGEQLAQVLAADGCDLVLAGRNAAKLAPLGARLGLAWKTIGLGDPEALDLALSDVSLVLHAAGPFVETALPMMSACLRAGVHYLDLSGEWPSFVQAMELGEVAREVGIMMMPGVGFTLVATDCLLALTKTRAPDAVRLRLAVSRPGVVTRGTLASSAGLAGSTALLRRGGSLCAAPAGRLTHDFDFGDGLASATLVSWPDVVTGQATTGVADIEVYSEAGWTTRLAYRAYGEAVGVGGARLRDAAARAYAALWPEGPPAQARAQAGFVLVCEALDRWRRPTRLRLRTRDGYTVSLFTAREIVRRVLAGDWAPGFRTPAGQYGGEMMLGLGCAELEPCGGRGHA